MKDLGEYNLKNGAYNTVISFGSDISEKFHGTYSTRGIDGASPTRMTAVRSTTSSSPLQTDDIPGAQSRPHHITTSKLHPPSIPRNPLDPHYILPPIPPPPPPEHFKFIRDGMNVSDIAGARTKAPPQPRAPHSIDVLQGSLTTDTGTTGINNKHRVIIKNYDIMDVSDINNKPPAASQQHQQQLPSQEERNNNVSRDHSALPQEFGVRKDYDWKSQKYTSMRQVSNSRQGTRQQIQQALLPYATPDTLTQLSLQLTLADKSRSGGVTSKEFENVLKNAGMVENKQQGKDVAVLLSKVSGGNDTGGGLINYKELLTDLYDATAGSGGGGGRIPANNNNNNNNNDDANDSKQQEVVLPGWYKARQRRLATDVGLALLQPDQEDTNATSTTTTSLRNQVPPPPPQTLYSVTGIPLLEKKKEKKKKKKVSTANPTTTTTTTSSPPGGASNDNDNDNNNNYSHHWFAGGLGSDHPSSDPSWRPTSEMVRIVKEQRSYHPHLQAQEETYQQQQQQQQQPAVGVKGGGKGGPVAAKSQSQQQAQPPVAGGGGRKGPPSPSVTMKQQQKGNDTIGVVIVDDDSTLKSSICGGSRRRSSTKTTQLVREDIALVRALDFD